MINKDELVVMRAIALCFKPFLKPEEAQVYTNLGKSQLAKKAQEMGVYRNVSGYYKREELDTLMNGSPSPFESAATHLSIKKIR
ncbi:hypothetical protein [Chitinophaga sp. Ak27]|uniref:hypothetical protein n=1 Tax=Chitinophaga sp. Ak27 TaxID=2726116 RepID=UPI00145E6E4C|nr:hypothetical protein [Chitinophaga sp. Ak27]NLU91363.1 hypothetical protein [Chitinophaga sp. Ak27]